MNGYNSAFESGGREFEGGKKMKFRRKIRNIMITMLLCLVTELGLGLLCWKIGILKFVLGLWACSIGSSILGLTFLAGKTARKGSETE